MNPSHNFLCSVFALLIYAKIFSAVSRQSLQLSDVVIWITTPIMLCSLTIKIFVFSCWQNSEEIWPTLGNFKYFSNNSNRFVYYLEYFFVHTTSTYNWRFGDLVLTSEFISDCCGMI